MATVSTNILIKGLSGKFGDTLMFKTLRGKTFVSAAPRKPDKRKESEAQRNTRSMFRKATNWAQVILQNPEKKAYYRERAKALKLPNAYTAAITDYMRKAKVEKMQEPKGVTYLVGKRGFVVNDVRATTNNPLLPVSVVKEKDIWVVNVMWAADEVPQVTLHITDRAGREQQWTDIPI